MVTFWVLSYLDDAASETAKVDEYLIAGDRTDAEAAVAEAKRFLAARL